MIFDSNPSVKRIRLYTSFIMVALYLALGLLFFFTDIALDTFPNYRKELGVTMMVYSVIRTVMNVRRIKREKENGF